MSYILTQQVESEHCAFVSTKNQMTKEAPRKTATIEEERAIAFQRIVSPLSLESFLSEFWGKSFVRVVGDKGKFTSLLSWEDLNVILKQHRLPPSQLKLFRDGKQIESNLYVTAKGRLRLNPASLINCLSEGATLILDNIDELAPAVGQLAEAFEDVLRSRTLVNLYASWCAHKGFNLHWDDQDTMILQVSGRKHWKIYSPTRLHPLKLDVEVSPTPNGEPAWEGILADGDLIYVPRGWWHVAYPLDEPSLHLTVTMVPANGTDFLLWIVERLKSFPEVRMDVPHLAGEADRKQYVSKLRERLNEFWDDHALEGFIAEWEANTPLPPSIHLPFAPAESRRAITLETKVRLATSRRLAFFEAPAGTTTFVAGRIRGDCSTDLVPALAELRGTASCTVEELCAHLADQAATSKLIILLTALVMRGVLQIEPSRDI
jgi:ribosomal protein L16 Arg81 hydroxylase